MSTSALAPQGTSFEVFVLGLGHFWPWDIAGLFGLLLASCALVHVLERSAPRRIVDQGPPGPFLDDWRPSLVAAIVNGPGLAFLVEIATVAAITRLPALTQIGLDVWPWWAQFGVYFLWTDFGRYWLHRWYHASDVLWRVHRVHHAPTSMDMFTNFRMHVLEILPRSVLLVLPFRILGLDPSVLLAFLALDMAKGFWHHANVRSYIGRANLVLNSPELHWWHHTVEQDGIRHNFGSTLSVWDRLFGTFLWRRGQWPAQIGVPGVDRFPRSYLGWLWSMVHDDASFSARGRAAPAAER